VRAADESGIVSRVTGAIADRDISIRQVLSEDPEFTDDAVLYVITDEELPGELINEIRAMPFVRTIELA
jgi:predicted regulator of amino acid metabolism with ACT domain